MSQTEPRGRIDLPTLVRGDTLDGFSHLYTLDSDGSELSITSARATLKSATGTPFHNWATGTDVTIVGGLVTFGAVQDTLSFPIGTMNYDVELTLNDGSLKTFVCGKMRVVEDYTV